MENEATVSKNFIEQIIEKDLAEGHCKTVKTRFPPEPNGYLHIGHLSQLVARIHRQRSRIGDLHGHALQFERYGPFAVELRGLL